MCSKSDSKEILLKPATNGQSDKAFLMTSNFVTKGLSAQALGLYTCIKSLKMCINQRDVFKLTTYGQTDKAFLLTSKFCPQGVVCPCSEAMIKSLKNVHKIRLQRDFVCKQKGLIALPICFD